VEFTALGSSGTFGAPKDGVGPHVRAAVRLYRIRSVVIAHHWPTYFS